MKVETIFSQAGIDIVAKPFLVGAELEKLATQCSEDFVRSLPKEVREGATAPVSVEILNGGKYYFVSTAYTNVTGKPCAVNTLRAKRGHASAETFGGLAHIDKDLPPGTELWQSEGSDWGVRIWEFTELPAGPLLVGDTIATGTTLTGVLEWIVAKMEAAGAVHDIFAFTIVGAKSFKADGGIVKKLAGVDAALARHGKQLHVTFANAQFALQENGTDMSPCPEMGTEYEPRALEAIKEQVPAQFLPSMRCAIWDWGDRFRNPKEHLEDVHAHYAGLSDVPAYISEGIAREIARLDEAEPQQPPAAE